jgi:DNA-binding NarL/FixJ family response regulator
VRIVIIEDHTMFREVLHKVCAVDLKLDVVGQAGDGHAAIELVKKLRPDLVLLDLHLPSLDGFSVAEAIQEHTPSTRILVLSSHCDEYTVYRAERAHVQGFIDKNTNSVAALKSAISAVMDGKVSFSDAFKRIRAARIRDPQSFDKLLTQRERDVLTLVGEPLGDDEIGRRLDIAADTVAKHRFNLLRKLGLKTTTDLVRYAREHGFTLSAPRAGDDAMLP